MGGRRCRKNKGLKFGPSAVSEGRTKVTRIRGGAAYCATPATAPLERYNAVAVPSHEIGARGAAQGNGPEHIRSLDWGRDTGFCQMTSRGWLS